MLQSQKANGLKSQLQLINADLIALQRVKHATD